MESDELSVITRVAQEESSFRFALALQQQAQRALLGQPLGDALSDEDLHLVLQQLGFPNAAAAHVEAAVPASAAASPDLALALELARTEAAEHRLTQQQPQPQQEEERRQQEEMEKKKEEEREAQKRQRQQRKAIDQLEETIRRGLAQQQATADEHGRRKKERAEAEEQKATRERDRRFAEDEDRRIAALRRREKESGWEAPPVWPSGVRFIMRNEEAWAEDLDHSAQVGAVDAGPAEGGGAMAALHHHHRRSAKQTTAGSAQVIAALPRMLDQIKDISGKPNNSDMVELRELREGHPAYKPDVFKYRRNGGRSYGVFAKVFIPKQTVIAQYCGLLVQASEESSGAYRLPINNRTDIDAEMAGNESRCINDYRDTGRTHNVQFYPHPSRPEHWVVSLADIQKGDELLLDYGEAYWKDIDDAEKNAQHEDEDYVAGGDSSSVATNRNVTPKRLRSSRSSLNVSQLLARQRVMCAACCVMAKINGSGWVDVGDQGTQTLDIWWAQHNKTCTALLPEATDDLDATAATPADGDGAPRGRRKMRAARRDTAMQRHLMVLVGNAGSPVPLSQFIDETTAADAADVSQKCAAEMQQHKKAKQARARKAAASPEWAVIRNQDMEIDQENENENENEEDEDEEENESDSESESESESEGTEGKQPDVSTSTSPAKDHSLAPMMIDGGSAAAERQPGTAAMPLGSTRAGTPAATRRKAPITRWHMEESDGKPVCIIDDDDDDADRVTLLSSSSSSSSLSSSSSTATTPISTAVCMDPEDATIVYDDDDDDDDDGNDDGGVDDGEEEDVYVAVTRSGKRKMEIDLLADSGEVSDKSEDDVKEEEYPLKRKPKRPYTSDLPAAPPTTSFPSAPASSSAARPPSNPPAPSQYSSSSSSSLSALITSVPSSAFPVSHSLSSLFAPPSSSSSSQCPPGLVQTLSVPSPPVSASSSLPSSPAASSPEFVDFFGDPTPPSTSPARPSPPSSTTATTTPPAAKTPPFTVRVPTPPPTAPSPPSVVSTTPTWRQLLAAIPNDPADLAAQTGEMSRVEILAALQTLASLTTSLVSSLARK